MWLPARQKRAVFVDMVQLARWTILPVGSEVKKRFIDLDNLMAYLLVQRV
jgi:hypothetical protein